MAMITSGVSQVYAGTSATNSLMVGYSAGKNYVARYSFKTDANGGSHVSWELPRSSFSGNGTVPPLRWYIGTSSNSHINAGVSTTTYHGSVTVSDNGGFDAFSGSADVVLMPNTTYYLWIFPATVTPGYYWLAESDKATLETSGAAGLVHIDNGGSFESYQVYIDNGSSWDMYIPYIDNGSSWDLCG